MPSEVGVQDATSNNGQMTNIVLDSIDDALAEFAKGEIVIVVDDEDRENEGDLIMAAEFATPEKIAFFAKEASGLTRSAANGAT